VTGVDADGITVTFGSDTMAGGSEDGVDLTDTVTLGVDFTGSEIVCVDGVEESDRLTNLIGIVVTPEDAEAPFAGDFEAAGKMVTLAVPPFTLTSAVVPTASDPLPVGAITIVAGVSGDFAAFDISSLITSAFFSAASGFDCFPVPPFFWPLLETAAAALVLLGSDTGSTVCGITTNCCWSNPAASSADTRRY
jgi:hypothetical protein